MQPGSLYHIYTHANGFENLFQSQENYRYFLRRYEHFIPPVADTLCYCLMPNHIHFLVRVKTEVEVLTRQGFKTLDGLIVIRQFGHLFNSYTQAYNKMYKRRGSLFIHSFKRKEITDDSYLTNVIRYIHANPVHHGFINNLANWSWSSYPIILSEAESFVKREEVVMWFGNRETFIDSHQSVIPRIQIVEF